jgi:hypothetical protein
VGAFDEKKQKSKISCKCTFNELVPEYHILYRGTNTVFTDVCGTMAVLKQGTLEVHYMYEAHFRVVLILLCSLLHFNFPHIFTSCE